MIRWLAIMAVATSVAGTVARAQNPPPPPPKPPVDSTKRARDSAQVKADSNKLAAQQVRGDTAKLKLDSITLSPPDSMMRVLLGKKGYQATRYQGDSVRFNAQANSLQLYGKPAAVERDKMKVAGDSVLYDANNRRVQIGGSPGRVRDPSRGEDIVASAPIMYDLDARRGTACRIRTSANSGTLWYLRAGCGAFISDSMVTVEDSSSRGVFLGENVFLSTDSSSNPHYHFEVGKLKKFGKNTIVGSPAKLYIGEIPVLWLPWFWSPANKGRNSGLLTPQFTFAELTRNTPSYRRHVENLGFYVALNDYSDARFALDWRSGASPRTGDPGFVKLRSDIRYKRLDWFINGSLGLDQTRQKDGQTNTGITFVHTQEFSKDTRLGMNLSYMTSTTVHQNTIINPFAQIANIRSSLNYATQLGPFATTLSGGQTQYPGRPQIDRQFPTLSLSTKPIEVLNNVTWTPSLSFQTTQSLHLDGPSEFGFRKFIRPDGTSDSVRVDRNTRNTQASFITPFKIGSFTINARASMSDLENDYPEAKLVIDPADTSIKRLTIFRRTYLTTFDWDLGMNLPGVSQGHWNVVPSITLRNVDPGAFLVRSERSGATFVSQSKRASYGLSISPTFFGFLNHPIGPFARIRHSITPSISYSYSPKASVSDEFLGALGRTRAGYLGALAQNRVSLTLNQVFEAKFKPPADTGSAPPIDRKIRLLSLGFSPIEYDFELAKATGRVGIATDRFNINASSDLLPGFSINVGYSLFDAPVISDTARFSPYPESIQANLTIGSKSGSGGGGLGPIGKLISWLTGEKAQPKRDTAQAGTGMIGGQQQQLGANTLAGQNQGMGQYMAGRSRPSLVSIPQSQGWSATFAFSSNHPRPPRGDNVISIDPRARCDVYKPIPNQYEICLRQQPPVNVDYSQQQTTGGGVIYQFPATRALSANTQFHLTENWATSWQTSYDLVEHRFTNQVVTLQRELKDWQALFGFQQSYTGSFLFTFSISLKPVPDLKFDYDQPSYRTTQATNR